MVVYQLDYRRSQRKTHVLHRNKAWKAVPLPALLLSPLPHPTTSYRPDPNSSQSCSGYPSLFLVQGRIVQIPSAAASELFCAGAS